MGGRRRLDFVDRGRDLAIHMKPLSQRRARCLVFLGAVLWSLNGLFKSLLTQPNVLDVGEPPLHSFVMGFYRALFAGLVFLPGLRVARMRWRPAMGVMVLCYGAMNALFMWAMTHGTAANALILQYTAPFWALIIGVGLLGEKGNRKDFAAVAIAGVGLAVIVQAAFTAGDDTQWLIFLAGLGSGVTFAGVLLSLRWLRDENPTWLTVQNQAFAALLLIPWMLHYPVPRWDQMLTLVVFGAVQLALPYWLVTQGMKTISSHEVGMIGLLEPLLSPLWAYLVAGEIPERATIIGGSIILLALVYRYWPRPAAAASPIDEPNPAVGASQNAASDR